MLLHGDKPGLIGGTTKKMRQKDLLQKKIRERQQIEKQERRKSILDAARKVFSEKGYLNAAVRDIALEASLSPGLIYHYYEGKDELYGAICEEAFHILLDCCGKGSSGEGTALDRLLAMARAYVRYYKEYPQYFDILSFRDLGFKKVNISASVLEGIERLSNGVLEGMQELVVECMREGSIRRTDDPRGVALCFWAAVEGLIFIDKRGYLETFQCDLDPLLNDMMTILLLGAKP